VGDDGGMNSRVGRVQPSDLQRVADARHRAAQQHEQVMGRHQQRIVDSEVNATRRAMLKMLRWRGGRDAVAFLDEDFLGIADEPAIYQAILTAAVLTSKAEFVDLQRYDPSTGLLRIVAQHGFTADFLHTFAVIDIDGPTACAAAVRAGRPVLVDEVAHSPVFVDQAARDTVLQAGTRAVYSYPLMTPGNTDVAGVLSFHHRRPSPLPDVAELVANGAAQALAASVLR